MRTGADRVGNAPDPAKKRSSGVVGSALLRGWGGPPLRARGGVLPGGDETTAGLARIAGGDQALADEHAVGALVGVGPQVLRSLSLIHI